VSVTQIATTVETERRDPFLCLSMQKRRSHQRAWSNRPLLWRRRSFFWTVADFPPNSVVNTKIMARRTWFHPKQNLAMPERLKEVDRKIAASQRSSKLHEFFKKDVAIARFQKVKEESKRKKSVNSDNRFMEEEQNRGSAENEVLRPAIPVSPRSKSGRKIRESRLKKRCAMCEQMFAIESFSSEQIRSSIFALRKLFSKRISGQPDTIDTKFGQKESKFRFARLYERVHVCLFCSQFFPLEQLDVDVKREPQKAVENPSEQRKMRMRREKLQEMQTILNILERCMRGRKQASSSKKIAAFISRVENESKAWIPAGSTHGLTEGTRQTSPHQVFPAGNSPLKKSCSPKGPAFRPGLAITDKPLRKHVFDQVALFSKHRR